MDHNFADVFDINDPLWQKMQAIFKKNDRKPKKKVVGRELHHKFPRSFSKKLNQPIDNDKDNLVSLTPGDHLLVHWICWKIARTGFRSSMAYAFNLMYKKSVSKLSLETATSIANDIDNVKE